ncbi:nitrilase-related carbon-nitrogen hydrolase [Fibrobacter sp. UBA4297]|uniref:nitrilase-related carbon-nitrogen hydrolase n=1 Tax=Fibrobacter sp. UBA4297 TaxID=1946536 RepID=UPI0025C0E06A|nr:nitrilase-related carbon-nitrogen hydrolase [Fibrobacter sp. UBA4297]
MLKVYLVQFDSAKGNKTVNLARAKKMIFKAKPVARSLVLLPEMFATGYVPADLDDAAEDFSSNESGATTQTLSEIADETNCTIMGAGITRASHGFYNHISIYKPHEAKEFCGYDKMNLFFPEKKNFKAGEEINLFKFNNWTIASFICYDLRFPEIFREATKQGANLITIQAAWPAKRRAHWETLLKARAIENQVYIAAVNAVSENPNQKLPLAGTSLIISPNGDILAEGPTQNEVVIYAELDIQAERDYRKTFPVLEGIVPPEFL